MLDKLDRILWWLERHRMAALGAAAIAVLAAIVVLVAGGGGSRPKVPAGAVAIVGDQPITRATFDHWTAIYRRSGVGGANPTAEATNHAVLQILVAASWTAQEAHRLGVTVTPAQVDQAVSTTYRQAQAQGVSRAKVLQQVGGTESDLRWEDQASLLGRALELHASKTAKAVSTADLSAAYAAEPMRWAHATRRDVQVILVADQATGDKAVAALRSGTSWAAAAKSYGSPQVKDPQTTLRAITPGKRDAGFERAVFGAPVNQLAGPTQVSTGWIVFRVLASSPVAAIPLSGAMATLRSELTSSRQSKAIGDYLAGFRRTWKARTACVPEVRDTTVCGA